MAASVDALCSEAVRKYAAIGSKQDRALILDVRNRLLELGWKIHCTQDASPPKYSYTSPDGKIYYSLKKICQVLAAKPLISDDHGYYSCLFDSSQHDDGSLLVEQAKDGKTPFQDLEAYSSISEPDAFVAESEHCPQAVIDWYVLTGQADSAAKSRSYSLRALSLKAKKHLRALGWTFWYADRKGRQELRYKSPHTGKNYYSLRMACKSCIEDGVRGPESVSSNQQPLSPVNVSHEIEFPSTNTSPSSAETGTVQTSMKRPRRCRKRKRESLCDDDYEAELDASCSVGGKRSRKIRSSKRVCKGDESLCDDDYEAELDAFCSVGGKRSRQLRSIKRVRKGDESLSDDDYEAELDAFCSVGGKRRRKIRSSKRVRKGDESATTEPVQRNPRTVVFWLIDKEVVLPGAEVHYRNGKEVLKKGRICGKGIKCDCCGEDFTLSKFEAHAGSTKHRPAANIFLEDGRSLLDCQKEALRINGMKSTNCQLRKVSMKEHTYERENDNVCSVCHYGGEIILCDRCPSSFHQSCLGLVEIPDGDWFCPSCCCKICSQGRYKGDSDDCEDYSVLVCDQCERKYHTGCLNSKGCTKLKNHPNENWFCSANCENIHLGLQNLLGKPFFVGADNLTWTLLKTRETKNPEADTFDHMEALTQVESKLNVALEVMHECFEPVNEARTGRDLVGDVIFSRGSELGRLNFRGFYTAILERNDEVITVATVRIYGQKVAEVPLVATRFQFRRRGMCRFLMNELEKKLSDLGVERIVLPAVDSLLSTWTNSFGFARMTDSERSELVDYSLLDFQETIMCQKVLKKTMDSGAVRPKPCVDLHQNHLLSSIASCMTETCY